MTDINEAGFISDLRQMATAMSDIRESFIAEGFTREEAMQVICAFVASISGADSASTLSTVESANRLLERIDAGV